MLTKEKRNEYMRNYYKRNKNKILITNRKYAAKHKKDIAINKASYYKRNKLHLLEQNKRWRENNKEYKSELDREYREKNKERRKIVQRKYMYKRRNSDIIFRLKCVLRKRVWDAIKSNSKSAKTLELLGCSIEEFKQHLELKFDKNMNWQNYGKYWEIDHIKPCVSFDLSKPEQQKECFYYTNLQPLEKIANRIKSDKIL